MKKQLLIGSLAIGMITASQTNAQISHLSNAGGAPTHYVGWAAGNNFPLNIRHNGNYPINFWTNGVQRMKLNGTTSYAVNSWNSARDGFLLLGSNTGTVYSTGAFSLLHLNSPAGAQDLGHRPWMETGITFTDFGDRAYIGYRGLGEPDVTEFVINWSDNPNASI